MYNFGIPIHYYARVDFEGFQAIIDAIVKLRKKIANEALVERGEAAQTHRYYTVTHNMKPVPLIHDGRYLQLEARQAPPKELMEAMGMPMPALEQAEKEETERG